ncbi:uncharacterized protein LOC117226780 [Megalopta genalis]|uniref:uncharacterized protein LOC117226780 n=1 Tax=Megalopta genalis TaxID=115081 RepID=UPI001442F47F|nr:coiled-coil domain-containing protein 50 [Megalopta genalis]
MAKSVLSSDSLPKAGRVNEVCREWLVHEDGALAYRLQDEEIREHYTGNKVRNAQVREDLPKAKVEQELESLRYQNYVQQQEEKDALVAKQIALALEREERQKERELQEQMRLQLRLDDEVTQLELEKHIQEEKDEELARKLQQEEEENAVDTHDGPVDEQFLSDQKIAMEAQDAELARMLQQKERAKARKARQRARQKKLEKQLQKELEDQNVTEKPQRPDKLDLKSTSGKSRMQPHLNYPEYPDPEEIQILDDPIESIREVPNVAAIIDPTYNGNVHRHTSSSSSSTVSPTYALPTPPQELMNEDIPCYMPIQGQRRNQMQSPSQVHEEKHKRRVKDGCKQQ